MMRKLFSAVLVLGLLVAGSSVSALAPEGQSSKEDRQAKMEERAQKQAEREAKYQQRQEEVTKLFNDYNPEGLGSFNAITDEHESFHESQKANTEAWRASIKASFDELKVKLDNGEITQEAFDASKEELKNSMSTYRDEASALRDSKKEELTTVREERQTIGVEIKAMKESGEVDEIRIAELLNAITDLTGEHLVVDEKYAELLNILRSNY